MHSSSDPFDFSEYSSSRDGADNPPSDSPWAGIQPAADPFGTPNDPFSGFGGASNAPAGNGFATPHQLARPSGVEQGRTPLAWVLGAFLVTLVGIGATLLTFALGPVAWAVLGWLLAGPVAALLLAQHMVADTRERTRPTYDGSSFLHGTYWVSVALAAVGIVLGAWQIAEWAGRL